MIFLVISFPVCKLRQFNEYPKLLLSFTLLIIHVLAFFLSENKYGIEKLGSFCIVSYIN